MLVIAGRSAARATSNDRLDAGTIAAAKIRRRTQREDQGVCRIDVSLSDSGLWEPAVE
jgi:hypothetical protein